MIYSSRRSIHISSVSSGGLLSFLTSIEIRKLYNETVIDAGINNFELSSLTR